MTGLPKHEYWLRQLECLKQAEPMQLSEHAAQQLRALVDTHPTHLYRPLLACAAADRVARVARDLGQLVHLARLLGDTVFFFTHLDLIATVLASAPPRCNGATLGQHALVLEYLLRVSQLKRITKTNRVEYAQCVAFLLQLEQRLSLLITARQASQNPMPMSLYALLVLLLAEIRVLVRVNPLCRPNWMDRLLEVAVWPAADAWTELRQQLASVYIQLEQDGLSAGEQHEQRKRDVQSAQIMHRLRAWTSTLPGGTAPPALTMSDVRLQWSERVRNRMNMLRSTVPADVRSIFLSAAMSIWRNLNDEEQQRVLRTTWQMRPHLHGERARLLHALAVQAPLLMQDLLRHTLPMPSHRQYREEHIEVDELAALGWLQITMLTLADRHRAQLHRLPSGTRRHPSTLQPPPLPFVASDIDTGQRRQYSTESTLLAERLGQLGISDAERSQKEQRERLQQRILLESAATMDGQERDIRQRARLPPAQDAVHQQLVWLARSPNAMLASQADMLLGAYERDEHTLLWRALHSSIGNGSQVESKAGFHRLRCHLSLLSSMPTQSLNTTLNFLVGMAKHCNKELPDRLESVLMEVFPVLAALVSHAECISIRDFRKNKADLLVTQAAQFWLTAASHSSTSTEAGPNAKSAELLSTTAGAAFSDRERERLMQLTSLRVSQSLLLIALLRHSPSECLDLAKLVRNFVPELPVSAHASQRRRPLLQALSELRARTWLTLLMTLIDHIDEQRVTVEHVVSLAAGLDRVLACCHSDPDVLPTILATYERLARRFRALLAQVHNEHVILLALFEAYVNLMGQPAAQQIEATWRALYQINADEFLFTVLWAIAPRISRLEAEDAGRARTYVNCFYQLLMSMDAGSSTEASAVSGEDAVPASTSTATWRSAQKAKGGMQSITFQGADLDTVPARQQSTSTGINSAGPSNSRHAADVLKLLVTIIAYQPASRSAEQFMNLLCLLVPHCAAHPVLASSIDALAPVMRDFAKQSKYQPLAATAPLQTHGTLNGVSGGTATPDASTNHPLTEQQRRAVENDHIMIRRKFIVLLTVFAEHGAPLTWPHIKCAVAVIRATLKDLAAARIAHDTVTTGAFIDSLLRPLNSGTGERFNIILRGMELLLRQLSSVFSKLPSCADYTGLVSALARALGPQQLGQVAILRELLLERFLTPLVDSMIRRHAAGATAVPSALNAAARNASEMTGELLAALLLHSEADVRPLLDPLRPSLLCRLLPRICLSLARFTSCNSGAGLPRPTVDRLLTVWQYPLSLFERCFVALLALHGQQRHGSNSKAGISGLGPGMKRVSLLAIEGVGRVADANRSYGMACQLAVALRAVLLAMSAHTLSNCLGQPQLQHWCLRIIRFLISLLLLASCSENAAQRSSEKNKAADTRTLHAIGPAAALAMSVWTLCECIVAHSRAALLLPSRPLLRQLLLHTVPHISSTSRPGHPDQARLISATLAEQLHSITGHAKSVVCCQLTATSTASDQLVSGSNNCSQYSVKQLLEHLHFDINTLRIAGY